jgi:hypothetical protein
MLKKLKKPLVQIFSSVNIVLKKYNKIMLALVIVGLMCDVFILKIPSDFRLFGILGAYILIIGASKMKSKISFLLCLCLLGAMYVSFLVSGASDITEKIAVWFVLFLTTGVIQQWNEIS